ncbi:MAG: 3-hydroxyacyl-ACP dehydratase FabZ family protein [Vulcanimicrobiota bacterium]
MRFFLVDRVDELIPGQSIRGVKAVSLSEDYLHDHFPGHPLFPGTLMVEALAQLGGFLVDISHCEDPQQRAILAQIDQARFTHPARPGDVLSLSCELSSSLGGAAQVEGRIQLGEQQVARALLTFVLRAVDSPRVHEQRRELYSLWTRHLKLDFAIR